MVDLVSGNVSKGTHWRIPSHSDGAGTGCIQIEVLYCLWLYKNVAIGSYRSQSIVIMFPEGYVQDHEA